MTTKTPRYSVLVIGHVEHRTDEVDDAIDVARDLASDLVDDGVYSSDDGWPTIVDRDDPDRRIDY